MNWVPYIPIATFAISLGFSRTLFLHYKAKPQALYLLWWLIGVATYGVGTFTESVNALFGWSEVNFRWWYISGALLGGAPLAQGTVYLMLPKRTAHALTGLLVAAVLVGSWCVWQSPVDPSLQEGDRLTGAVFEWQWVRRFSPFINLYAVAFLVGGAVWSAVKYFRTTGTSERFWGNLLIALGAILPGIGGSFTRFGHVEVLYVTELLGLGLIIWAYQIMRKAPSHSVHMAQRVGS